MFAKNFEPVVNILASKEEIARFARKAENSRDWLTLVKELLFKIAKGGGGISTLSQLGSDWFGDSKKLRTGPWRCQLALVDRILAANAHTDTSAFESQIDALVYRLYSLSSEEIAVVEGCK